MKWIFGILLQTYQVYGMRSAEDIYKILTSQKTNYVIIEESICNELQFNKGCRTKDLLDISNGHVSYSAFTYMLFCWFWHISFFSPPFRERNVIRCYPRPLSLTSCHPGRLWQRRHVLFLQARKILPGDKTQLLAVHKLFHPSVLEPFVPRVQSELGHLLSVLTAAQACHLRVHQAKLHPLI